MPTIATHSIISQLKEQAIQAITSDSRIATLLGASSQPLLGNVLFPYPKIPAEDTDLPTYLTIQVQLLPASAGSPWTRPRLVLTVFSSESHILLSEEDHTVNRNDSLASLLDQTFSGSSSLGGLGPLTLVQNREGFQEPSYYFRRLIYETRDWSPAL